MGSVQKPVLYQFTKEIPMAKFEKDNNLMSGKGEWEESEHPRDNDGKFTSKGGGQSTTSQEKDKTQSIKKRCHKASQHKTRQK